MRANKKRPLGADHPKASEPTTGATSRRPLSSVTTPKPKQALLQPNLDEAAKFLSLLRPGGMWVLTAIIPDGETTTCTLKTLEACKEFVQEHNGDKNIYYSVNVLKRAMSKKASKQDIASVEYMHVDADPAKDETSEEFKARFLKDLNGAEHSFVVDSGNGIQVLDRLAEPFKLNGDTSIEDIEARNYALAEAFGASPSTRNVDRILRVPGTVNWPNATKRKLGRVAVLTRLIEANDIMRPLEDFPKAETSNNKTDKGKTSSKKTAAPDVDKLEDVIRNGGSGFESRSEAVWWVVMEMLRRSYRAEMIVETLLDRDNGISEHVLDQAKPREYADKQIAHALSKLSFTRNKKSGKPLKNQGNIRIALLKMGVGVRHDRFADRVMLDGLVDFGPVFDDAALEHIWLTIDQRFQFMPTRDLLSIVIHDTARLNGFHPVCDYLDGLVWDGKPRIDRWLATYAGATSNDYTRAVGSLTLIAAVRRVRHPGCKFDEMLVLEQPQQGTDKSTALSVLAVHDDWFCDDLPLNADGKRVIEQMRGRWLIEAAELSGMRKADIEHLKAFLSRQIDRARLAYGREVTESRRQSIVIGTTNNSKYLKDTSGNRRYWPVLIRVFDVTALRRDRDQLWAEAAAREAKGESIRLAPELWPQAAVEQKERHADDPFVAMLDKYLGNVEGKIRAADVWTILNLSGGQLTQDVFIRSSEAMKQIGWVRPNKAGIARFNGSNPQAAFVRGGNRNKEICVERENGKVVIITKETANGVTNISRADD